MDRGTRAVVRCREIGEVLHQRRAGGPPLRHGRIEGTALILQAQEKAMQAQTPPP